MVVVTGAAVVEVVDVVVVDGGGGAGVLPDRTPAKAHFAASIPEHVGEAHGDGPPAQG